MKLDAASLPILACLFLLSSCLSEPVPEGRIRVKNDIGDSSYNVIEVSAGGSFYTLKPGQKVLLPPGSTRISMSRQYERFTRHYEVECPAALKEGITIKMIDVHVNRIAGGCSTVFAEQTAS